MVKMFAKREVKFGRLELIQLSLGYELGAKGEFYVVACSSCILKLSHTHKDFNQWPSIHRQVFPFVCARIPLTR